uniref:Uncharacterized protein n=1 Tax=Candidatus Kentrum sp. DK TaxID=2126562 RepID=A0A450T815_9GAMM|nr:MAG: hypothetical protein BECKDK2373C_GA0170839_100159 [Candidatus Kentron sp. DK]VFJ62682.1 MAG: hypothetical protein BECKDK2373B_GA0170837_11146 [Candidatus Kentron sp. DK]
MYIYITKVPRTYLARDNSAKKAPSGQNVIQPPRVRPGLSGLPRGEKSFALTMARIGGHRVCAGFPGLRQATW